MNGEFFYIYRKDGSKIQVGGTATNPEYLCVHELQLDDTFLGQKQVTITIKSPTPIEWKGQEYIILDNDKYTLKHEPSLQKQARRKTYGEAFVYNNVILQSLTDETTRVKFQDYVLEDNNIHYSSMPTVYFYGTVKDLAMRIQANLDRVYKDDEKWTIVLGDDLPTTEKQKTYEDVSVWDAITDIWNVYKVLFYTKGRTLYIGTGASTVPHDFMYGIGKGLKSLKKETSEDNEIYTRLHVYGSQKNLPYRYYNNLGVSGAYYMTYISATGTAGESGYEIDADMGGEFNLNMFTMENTGGADRDAWYYFDITVQIADYTCDITAMVSTAGGKYARLSFPSTMDSNLAIYLNNTDLSGTKIYVIKGIDTQYTPTPNTTNTGGYVLESMYLPNLMLPLIRVNGNVTKYYDANFKEITDSTQAVYRMVKTGFGGKDLDIYLESVKGIEQFGVLEGNVTFDNDSDTDFEDLVDDENGIYPTLSVATDGTNEIVSATQLTDAGVYDGQGNVSPTTFEIIVKPGFNPADYVISGETAQISFKSGALIGRTFDFDCSDNGDGTYTLTCTRITDNSIGLAFPNSSYNVQAGDKFVFLGIEFPDEYIQAAEIRLLNAGLAYLANYDHTKYTYTPELDNIFLARTENRETRDALAAGATFWFTDEDVNGTSGDEAITIKLPISNMTMKIGSSMIREYEITLADTPDIDSDLVTRTVNAVSKSYSSFGGSGGIDEGSLKILGKKLFLSKVSEDTAAEVITFLKGIKIGSSGKWYIDKDGKAALSEIVAQLITVGEIKTEYLTVTKAAHFFKLVVDEMKSTSGTVINTAANCVLDKVVPYDSAGNVIADDDTTTAVRFWRCYWKAEDGDGKAISNQWAVDDQAIVYTCNLAEGTSYDASNNYWWRLVEGVGSEESVDIDGDAFNCHYIDVSNLTYDAGEFTELESGVPQVGDNVAQLGNRSDETRQGAIIFAAYATPDIELTSPSWAQYQGITSFDLPSARYTWFAMNGNMIRGNLTNEGGTGFTSYVHFAYSNTLEPTDKSTPDGEEWVKGVAGGKQWKYTGMVSDHTENDEGLSFSDYSWQEVSQGVAYSCYLSAYSDIALIDAEGNVVGGLWKDSGGTKQYLISSALFVKKNSTPLVETFEETVEEGEYRIASVSALNCDYEHRNGAFYITAIRNCRDGVAETLEDIDYDAMRNMSKCSLTITVDIEGEDTRVVSMPVSINHSNETYITTDISNNNAAVVYNTRTKKLTGLNTCSCFLTKKRNGEYITLSGLVASGYDGLTLSTDITTGEVKVTDVTDTTPRTEHITLTSTCVFAGVSYESVHVWNVSIRNDVSLYQIQPTATSISVSPSLVCTPQVLGCSAYVVGEGESWKEINPSDYNLTLQYSVDDGEFGEYSSSIVPSSKSKQYVFQLIDDTGFIHDKETVPVIQSGSSPVIADLDNEMGVIACSSDGTVLAGLPLSTNAHLYYGTEELDITSAALGSAEGVTATCAISTDKKTATISVTAVEASMADTVNVPVVLKATQGGVEYTRTINFIINKVRNGENAVVYELLPDTTAIKVNSDGDTATPTTVTCALKKTDGNNASEKVTTLPDGYSMQYVYAGTTSAYTINSALSVSGMLTNKGTSFTELTFQLLYGSTLIDTETIPVVRDGAKGDKGDKGDTGDKGADGTSIASTESEYAAFNSTHSDAYLDLYTFNDSVSATGWSADYPYLYARTIFYDASGNEISRIYTLSKWGEEGTAGEDGWTVTFSPECVSIPTTYNSSTGKSSLDLSNAYASVCVKCGGNTATTTVSVSSQVNCSSTSISNNESSYPKVTFGNISTDGNYYYGSGYVELTINAHYNDGKKTHYLTTLTKTLSFAVTGTGYWHQQQATMDSWTSKFGSFDYDTYTKWQSEIEQKVDAIDLSVLKNDLEVAGVHLNGSNSLITIKANSTQFVDTDGNVLGVFTDDGLVAGSLQTFKGTAGQSVKIDDGMITITGTNKAYIEFGINDSGYPIMNYYSTSGSLIWKLDNNGLDSSKVVAKSWTEFTFIDLSQTGITIPTTINGYVSLAQARVLFKSGYGKTSYSQYTVKLYRYTAAKTNGIYTADSSMGYTATQAQAADGKYFTSKASGKEATGKYADILTQFMQDADTSASTTNTADYLRTISSISSGTLTGYTVKCTYSIYNQVNGSEYD